LGVQDALGASGVSTHASAREATRECYREFFTKLLFQPTPPRGRRRQLGVGITNIFSVSTHASAREATGTSSAAWARSSCFNPRLRAGGDLLSATLSARSTMFQPTPPRGRRRDAGLLSAGLIQFQPTPPRGRRLSAIQAVAQEFGFQPTPPRGRRHSRRDQGRRARDVSTHASAREATWSCAAYRCEEGVSTHASAREAT